MLDMMIYSLSCEHTHDILLHGQKLATEGSIQGGPVPHTNSDTYSWGLKGYFKKICPVITVVGYEYFLFITVLLIQIFKF